jgi:hypothetical protein
MLRSTFAFAVLAAATAAGAATAQKLHLSAAEARAELFGVRLIGVHEGINEPWQECIEPSGRTVYVFMRETQEGRLSIEDDGRACFAYADDGYAHRSCYLVQREGENYRFDQFITRRIERGVERCEGVGAFVEALPHASAR